MPDSTPAESWAEADVEAIMAWFASMDPDD